jgi:outer membrane protein OmpA-like peptidoglycan-associated protein
MGSVAPLYTVIWQPRVGVLWYPLPESAVSPFFGAAAGVTTWRTKYLDKDEPGLSPGGATVTGYDKDGNLTKLNATDFTGTFTLGFDVAAAENMLLSLGARYHLFPENKKDDVGWSDYHYDPAYGPGFSPLRVDANTAMIEGFVAVTFLFGNSDRDHDGIRNNIDLCPDQPEDMDGFEDEDGCPDPDNDKDGIPDIRDQCPNQPEDIDGFEDADGCPDPDNDKDGIVDTRDKCPDDPEDFDGYQDDDGCPDPDNDGDGVLDTYDQCPDTPYGIEVDAKGCPVPPTAAAPITPPETAPQTAQAPAVPPVQEIKQDVVLKGVTFASGTAVLTPASKDILRDVARSLLAFPDVIVEIRGYTDNIGAPAANRTLSENRALAVRDYLMRFGVMPSRLTAVGYGADSPIASNDTAAGRAENRRVELHRLDHRGG